MDEKVQRIKNLASQNFSNTEIAEKTKLKYEQVRHICRKYKIEVQSTNGGNLHGRVFGAFDKKPRTRSKNKSKTLEEFKLKNLLDFKPNITGGVDNVQVLDFEKIKEEIEKTAQLKYDEYIKRK